MLGLGDFWGLWGTWGNFLGLCGTVRGIEVEGFMNVTVENMHSQLECNLSPITIYRARQTFFKKKFCHQGSGG